MPHAQRTTTNRFPSPMDSTRHSLLVQIRDPQNSGAWAQFVDAYAPLVYRYARRQGMQDADAADITQDVLRSIVQAAGDFVYDPSRGRFRTWLYTVARNKVINQRAKQQNKAQAAGDTVTWQHLQNQPDPAADDSGEWDREYERRLFDWACERVKSEFREATWQAFWRTAVEGRSPDAVAQELGLSVGAVYVAKSRVLAAMKAEVKRLVGEEEA
jgi:RNA polymerase sigma factor (sigma-70 family)